MKKKDLLFKLGVALGPVLVRLLGITLRITRLEPSFSEMPEGGGLFVFWHGKFFIPLYLHRNQGIYVMVSEHKDGELIARILHKMGLNTVRGSSTRGGKKAFIGMLKQLKNNNWNGITPDGPKGPRQVMKNGTPQLSAMSGKDILLINWYARRKWQFSSWDKYELPKPFAKVVVAYKLIPALDKGTDIDEAAKTLGKELLELESRCYEAF